MKSRNLKFKTLDRGQNSPLTQLSAGFQPTWTWLSLEVKSFPNLIFSHVCVCLFPFSFLSILFPVHKLLLLLLLLFLLLLFLLLRYSSFLSKKEVSPSLLLVEADILIFKSSSFLASYWTRLQFEYSNPELFIRQPWTLNTLNPVVRVKFLDHKLHT